MPDGTFNDWAPFHAAWWPERGIDALKPSFSQETDENDPETTPPPRSGAPDPALGREVHR